MALAPQISAKRAASPRRKWEIVLGCVLGLLLAVAVGWAGFAIFARTRHHTCQSHLRQIAQALQNYHEQHGTYPPSYVLGPDGQPWHSWRVLILPQLGEQPLYGQYRFDQPWNSDHNRALVAHMPHAFHCPSCNGAHGTTPYLAIVGERTVWPGPHGLNGNWVIDGLSNTLQLMEADQGVEWTEPRDLSVDAAWLAWETPPPHSSGRSFSMCDGAVRVGKSMEQSLFVNLAACGNRKSMGPLDRLPDWLRRPPAEQADWGRTRLSSELRSTEIAAASSLPLDSSRTQVWCATFQLVWDQLREQCGGEKLDFQPAIPLTSALNVSPFPRDALSSDSVLLHAGAPGAAADRQLRAEFARRFPAAPVHIEDSQDDPSTIRIYAYLEKRLPFVELLERHRKPLQFRGAGGKSPVQAFGVRERDDPATLGEPVFAEQIFIRDYVSDENFVLELATKGDRGDRVCLARVTPQETLAKTWQAVQQRMEQPNRWHNRPHLMSSEPLLVPVLAFNLEHELSELHNGLIHNWMPEPLRIVVARQSIRFRLDEAGATLISLAEGEGIVIEAVEPPPIKPRRFVLDHPFLLVLREGESLEPYFMAWIANDEVMQK